MILTANTTDCSVTKGKKYICFGIDILLDRNEIYALIRRDSDLIPILERLDKFCIFESNDLINWKIKRNLNGLRISFTPLSFCDFNWDLYHDGDENIEKEFEKNYLEFKKYINFNDKVD